MSAANGAPDWLEGGGEDNRESVKHQSGPFNEDAPPPLPKTYKQIDSFSTTTMANTRINIASELLTSIVDMYGFRER